MNLEEFTKKMNENKDVLSNIVSKSAEEAPEKDGKANVTEPDSTEDNSVQKGVDSQATEETKTADGHDDALRKLQEAADAIRKQVNYKELKGSDGKDTKLGNPDTSKGSHTSLPTAVGSTNNASDTDGGKIEAIRSDLIKTAGVMIDILEDSLNKDNRISTLEKKIKEMGDSNLTKSVEKATEATEGDSEDTPNPEMIEKVNKADASREDEALKKQAFSDRKPRFQEESSESRGDGVKVFDMKNPEHRSKFFERTTDAVLSKTVGQERDLAISQAGQVQTMYRDADPKNKDAINSILRNLFGDTEVKVIY